MKFMDKLKLLAVLVGSIIFIVNLIAIIWESVSVKGWWDTFLFWQTMPLWYVSEFLIKITIISFLIVFPIACLWHGISVVRDKLRNTKS